MRKQPVHCAFVLIFTLASLPLFSAGNAENTKPASPQSSPHKTDTSGDLSAAKSAEGVKGAEQGTTGEEATHGTEQKATTDTGASPQTPAAETESATDHKVDGADNPLKQTDGKKIFDASFASIQRTGLTIAEGNKWYYEHFDQLGRSAFAVEYENDTEIKRVVWSYKDSARHPVEKTTYHADKTETIRYDDAGRVILIETYDEKKTVLSKTDYTYNESGNLIEQITVIGNNTDKLVWDFAGDKAVSQTKYRNGKKTAFIELHSDVRIVHLYVDDKEVLVTEEQ